MLSLYTLTHNKIKCHMSVSLLQECKSDLTFKIQLMQYIIMHYVKRKQRGKNMSISVTSKKYWGK